MNTIRTSLLLIIITLAFFTIPLHGPAFDKPSACVEMTDKAQAFIQEKGKDYTLKVFGASKGPFIDKEMYVFACSMDNKLLAHPFRRDLIGTDVNDVRDTKGKLLFQEFRKVAEEKGSGWVDYWWAKPGETGEFPKTTYIRLIPGHDMYVGVGFYEPR